MGEHGQPLGLRERYGGDFMGDLGEEFCDRLPLSYAWRSMC